MGKLTRNTKKSQGENTAFRTFPGTDDSPVEALEMQ